MAPECFLFESRETLLTHLVDVCPDGIIGVDSAGMVIIFNPKAADMLQRPVDSVLGKLHIRDIYGSFEKARIIKAAIYSDDHGGANRLEGFETDIVDAGGKSIPIRLSAALLRSDGKEIGSVGFFHDLTRRKTLEEKLRILSITDGLTGLYNQRYFYICLSEELKRAGRYGRPLSIITFDLDHFKQCNDRFGHLEGDNVLRMVGDLLNTVTRQSDFCFRYGGDEFFILLPETPLSRAAVTAEKIRTRFNEQWLFSAFEDKDAGFRVSLSIGVAERRDETEPQALIQRVDMAMYRSKRAGGDRVTTVVGEEMEDRAAP